jgi:hypothetical protein
VMVDRLLLGICIAHYECKCDTVAREMNIDVCKS